MPFPGINPKFNRPVSGAAATLPDRVLGLGTDLCAVSRMRRELAAPERGFVAEVFLPAEIARCRAHPQPARPFAACYAVKESVIKSLARSRGQGSFWQDIEVQDVVRGRAAVTLHGRLSTLADALGVRHIHVAYAHDRDYAAACAIATGRQARHRRSTPPCLPMRNACP